MKSSRDILFTGRRLIEAEIAKEARAQGHYLTGNLERSMTATVTEAPTGASVRGEVAGYAAILNNGVPARSASMKQFPFLVRYWLLRGLDVKSANRAAAATIKKWMKFGMPTVGSFRHSRNGYREGVLDRALAKALPRANTAVLKEMDQEIQKIIRQTKSGVV